MIPNRIRIATILLAAGSGIAQAAAPQPVTAAQARALHFDAIVVDTHDDTTQRLLDPAFDLAARHADGGLDLPRAVEGGLDAWFFSIYTPGTLTGAEAVRQANAQIDAVHRHVERHRDRMVLATTAAEVRQAARDGRIAVLIGVEGGHMIDSSLATLRQLFDRGARYLTLTHNVNVGWAHAAADATERGGLDYHGREIVREMNRLGMIVDVSHVSDETFRDVLETSAAPVFASHSSSRALCNVPRNMSDDMIHALAAKGGVVQVNYHVGFLSQAFADAVAADGGRLRQEMDAEVDRRCGTDEACSTLQGSAVMREYVVAGRLPRVEWTAVVDHIDHIAKLVGVDHVGLGSDFDGAQMPFGLEDASRLPQLTQALLERGYAADDVRKILGGNTLRVMEQVERVAREQRALADTSAAR
ncbi:MAG: dipeptidase [Steroidobacteraceae bacterium]